MKIEFLIPGSPTDAFFSQAAMFRLGLDSLGGIYERARVVLCLGAPEIHAIPPRWRPYMSRIDVLWAPVELVRLNGTGGVHRYDLIDAASDLSILCDADTLMVRPFDPQALRAFVDAPAIRGVIAHYCPPLVDDTGKDYGDRGGEWFWRFISARAVGRIIPCSYTYSLDPGQQACPFYVNYGFVCGTFEVLRRLKHELASLLPRIRADLANRFAGQIGIALSCHAAGLPVEALAMRYNFPNDPAADARYPDELAQAVLLHYLRLEHFDRQRIFVSASAFHEFLGLPLDGSNRVFQARVREITGGVYPFA